MLSIVLNNLLSETSPAKIRFANNKNSDPSFANVLESIGIGKVLISRISHTPLPLPANLPHAPKILKKVDKLSTIGNVLSSTEHTQSVPSGNKSSSNIVTKSFENDTIKSVRSNDSYDDDINNENDNENCQNKNDDDDGGNSNTENTITVEKPSVETSFDDNALEITDMTLENTDLNRESKEEKEYSDSSDMDVDMDIDLGYDSGDNCNDEIENTRLCSMSNDYDDDNDNDGVDLIDFEANYTVTSRLWGNRNGQNFPVENGVNNSQITDVKDVSNLIDKSTVQKDNEKNNDVTDEKSKINDTGASVIRFRKSPLNSTLSPVEPVGEKRAGIPRCGSKYQADVEPFKPSSSLLQPLDNVRTHMLYIYDVCMYQILHAFLLFHTYFCQP